MAASRMAPEEEISVGLLLNSIRRGDFRGTRELLKENPGLVRAKGPDGASAILLAVYRGHPEMVPLFVQYGAQRGHHGLAERLRRQSACVLFLLDQQPQPLQFALELALPGDE